MVGDNRSHVEKLRGAALSEDMGSSGHFRPDTFHKPMRSWSEQETEQLEPVGPTFTFVTKLDGNMAQYGPDIRRFVDAMIYKLERNAPKGRWEKYSLEDAFGLLQKEVEELRAEITGDKNMVRTMLEAADVANFALIVAAIVMERGR